MVSTSPTGWYRELQPGEKRTFWACFGGWTLDAMDVQIFSFAIPAIIATFAITNADAGLIGTATLLTSAFGWLVCGRAFRSFWARAHAADYHRLVRILHVSVRVRAKLRAAFYLPRIDGPWFWR